MSMDLEVWSPRPFKLPRHLPKTESWTFEADEWAYEGNGWHILISSDEADPEDHILKKLSDARYVAYVNLEPIGTDSAAYTLLEEIVRTLSKENAGIWVDSYGVANLHNEGVF